VKGYFHVSGGLDQLPGPGFIYGAIGIQQSKNNAFATVFSERPYVFEHDLKFPIGIEEISAAGSDHGKYRDPGDLKGFDNHTNGWGSTAVAGVVAEFDAIRTRT
jgi:hypothetical protein